MESAKPNNFLPLLNVFRLGLSKGIIPKDEVIQWADDIINNTDAPNYLFIELSLGNNANHLIEIIDEYITPSNNPICYRVLLALIYHRIQIHDVEEVEKTAILVGGLSSWDILTSFESNTTYMFEDYDMYYSPDMTQLQVEMINFLNIYKDFTLENYEQWTDINVQVLELLKEEEIQVNIVNESLRKAWAKKDKKRKLKFHLKKIGAMVFLLVFFSLIIALLDDGKTSHFTLYFILSYFCLKLGYSWWERRNK